MACSHSLFARFCCLIGLAAGRAKRLPDIVCTEHACTREVQAEYERNTSEARASTSIPCPYLCRRNTVPVRCVQGTRKQVGITGFQGKPFELTYRSEEHTSELQSPCNL